MALETEEPSDREDRREDAEGKKECGCDVDPPWFGFSVNSLFFIQGFRVTGFGARKPGWAIETAGPPGLGSGQSEGGDPPDESGPSEARVE